MLTRQYRNLVFCLGSILVLLFVQLETLGEQIPSQNAGGGVLMAMSITRLPVLHNSLPFSNTILIGQGIILFRSLLFLAVSYFPAQWGMQIASSLVGLYTNPVSDISWPKDIYAHADLTWGDGSPRTPGASSIQGLGGWDAAQLSQDRYTAQMQFLAKHYPEKVEGKVIPTGQIALSRSKIW